MPEAVDAVEMQAALSRLRRTSGLPVVFGGLLTDARHARIAELNGAQTSALRGLVISAGSGLGGKAIALSRPCAVTDYPAARHISHEYDAAVAAEGLRSVVAAPVVVRRAVRGVLYGALRTPVTLGDRTFDAVVAAARDVEQSLAVRDSARQLLAAGRGAGERSGRGAGRLGGRARGPPRPARPGPEGRGPGPARRVAGGLRAARLGVGGARASTAREVRLAPREVDVVACVAAGATNAGAAERLGAAARDGEGVSAVRHAEAGGAHPAGGGGGGAPGGAAALTRGPPLGPRSPGTCRTGRRGPSRPSSPSASAPPPR